MIIDLRSDTVTRPTKPMLQAMMEAKVGDDVFGEDPTVTALEEKTAELFGKEAGLFCPTGTMTNQVAIKVHTQPGDEVICDITSHIYNYEGGGIAFNSGVQARPLQGDRGRISVKQVAEAVNPVFDWLARTSLVSVENTANRAGGSYYTFLQLKQLSALCAEKQLAFHLDGARIFNALVETGDGPHETGSLFDSLSVCLSKGLGAPAGSVLLGSKDFIKKARRIRKVLGGGMRQAGYIAAAGIYALDHHVLRLKEDHKRAKLLADSLAAYSFVENILPVESNIIIFTLSDKMKAEDFVNRMAKHNIKVSSMGTQTLRFVTHLDYTDDMLQVTINALQSL